MQTREIPIQTFEKQMQTRKILIQAFEKQMQTRKILIQTLQELYHQEYDDCTTQHTDFDCQNPIRIV